MKSLLEYSQQNLLPIQHVFELSDELLKRAADAARERNSAIEKRRAKEFEDWLNSPKRQKIQELSGKSKYYKKFKEACEKYLEPAMRAYEDHDTNETQSLIKKFYKEIANIFSTIETSNIKITLGDYGTWYEYRKPSASARRWGYGNYLSDAPFSFKPRWRKGDDTIFELGPGLKFNVQLKNIDDETIRGLGYKRNNSGRLLLNVYKDGSISAYVRIEHDHFLPSDFENDAKELYDIFFNDLHCDCSLSVKDMLGKKSSKESLTVGDFFTHLNYYEDFTKYDLIDGLPKIVRKIENYFKLIDPSSKFEWTNKESLRGYYAFNAKIDLTYKGKDIKLIVRWEGDYDNTIVYIKANDEQIFNLNHTTTHWDAGLASNNHYQEVSDKINDIFS